MDELIVEAADATGLIRLNRPDRGNSVTPEVVTDLGTAFRQLAETESVKAIVFTGTGSVFCAGADVREMYDVYQADGADGLVRYLAEVWMPAVQQTVRTIWNSPKPVVAAFNGAATAGGLDFGLSCDLRVAASTARFAESYVNLGMVPVAGGAYLLPLVTGLSAATRLLASGKLIDADRAHALNIVDSVCEPDELNDRARELAAELAHGPGETFAKLKQIARRSAAQEFDAALGESLKANVELMARADVRERIVAVMERFTDAGRRRV